MAVMRRALLALLFFLLSTLAYTALVTGVAAAAFPDGAGGSLLRIDGRIRGSRLLGQDFEDPGYFRGRPSQNGYDPLSGSASNLGPSSAALARAVAARRAELMAANGGAEPPAGLLAASGSGLDPDIDPESARYQVARIAAARGLDAGGAAGIERLVTELGRGRELGFMGEERVNVVELNLELDKRFPRR